MSGVSCMGGFCSRRDQCRLYWADGRYVSERLCEHGTADAFEPIRVVRRVGEWERGGVGVLAPARWHEPLH
jgi:hypothetical protein